MQVELNQGTAVGDITLYSFLNMLDVITGNYQRLENNSTSTGRFISILFTEKH
jgi:hypothetical protein